ncbi:MAG: hypothetical protein DHS20C03_23180 [Minwuia thermotolerans]|nr:MAG: hypothetical protein DHS20C03_23180 [Minwuia thermotolerans]
MTATSIRSLLFKAGVAATVIFLMVAAIFTIFFVHERYEASLHPSKEVPWLASQLETEYLRTSEALKLYSADAGISHQEVQLRFEIYWSRVELMAGGARLAGIEDETWRRLEPMLFSSLSALDAVVLDPDFHQTPAGQQAINQHLSLWKALHAFSQRSIRFIWSRDIKQERDAMITVMTAMAVTLILVIFVAVVIFVMARRHSAMARSERRAKELALESNGMLERFLASMSHELRTPLNAIIGFSEVMSLGKLGPLDSRYQGYARDILGSGRHLLGLVDQLLDVSRPGSRRAELELSNFSIAGVLHDSVKMMSVISDAKSVSMSVHVPRDFSVSADSRKLTQILVNLLSNAVKFTHAGGTVSVSLDRAADGEIAVAVRDTGVGMSAEVRERAFDPFFRSPDPYVSSCEGTGLGLAISRDMASQMGFGLDLESAPGKGTTATLRIPAKRCVEVKVRNSNADEAAEVQERAPGVRATC